MASSTFRVACPRPSRASERARRVRAMTREMTVTTPRSAADEARDPTTSPDRLLELTQKHPQLQGLIVTNPSCPEVAKEWILATNPWAKGLHDQQQGSAVDEGSAIPEPESAAGPDVAAGSEVAEEPESAPGPETARDPDAVSAWGDLFEQPPAPTPGPSADEPAAPEPEPSAEQSPSVHVTSDSGVVPLGPAVGPAPTAALPPVAATGAATTGAAPGAAMTGAAPQAAAPPPRAQDEDTTSGGRRWIWLACGGCLILAIVLLIAAIFGGRALLSGDDETYQRPASDTATEQTEEPTAEETTEEEPEPDPVSPAPEGAAEMDALSSPTGNITCSLDGETVGCSVADRDFSEAGLEDCSEGPFSIQVADGEASSACGQSFADDSAPALEYGDSAVSGEVACTSEFDGMTCWNTQTGNGFFVNRVTYETL